MLRSLEHALYVKVLIFVAFVAGLAFLVFSGQQPEPTKNFVIALLFLATAMIQLWINQPKTFSQNSRILLVFGVIFIQLAVTKLVLVLCNSGNYQILKPEMGGLITPYAFAPLVLSVLLGRNHGLYAAVFQADSCRHRGRTRHLAVIARVRFHRPNQFFLADR